MKPQTPNNGAAFYQVCYSSDTAFVNRSGNVVNTGLLPDCNAATPPPCVVSITKDKAGQIVEKVSVPSGDPKFF